MAVLRPHLALTVSDVERSSRFYSELFGTAPTKVRPGYAKFEVREPALNFTLNEGRPGNGPGAFNHAGIQVGSTEEVLATQERLRAAGLAAFEEMDTTCCYARQDKVWVRDPDGNAWEVFVTHEDAEREPGADAEPRSARELPLAGCSLDAAGLAEQRERARSLAGTVRAAHREGERLEVVFGPKADPAAVEALVSVEQGCCPFLALDWAAPERRLTIEAPPERREVLDALAQALGA
jgi:catechol 2,3-dioxygenase-like lactoylglutathione lyase family enzyme